VNIPPDLLIPAVSVVLAAFIGAASAWYVAGAQRKKALAEAKKATADAAETLTGAALKLVEKLQLQITDLEKDVEELQCAVERQRTRIRVVTKLNARLITGASVLIAQIEELGQKPEWRLECDVAKDEELVAELERIGNNSE